MPNRKNYSILQSSKFLMNSNLRQLEGSFMAWPESVIRLVSEVEKVNYTAF